MFLPWREKHQIVYHVHIASCSQTIASCSRTLLPVVPKPYCQLFPNPIASCSQTLLPVLPNISATCEDAASSVNVRNVAESSSAERIPLPKAAWQALTIHRVSVSMQSGYSKRAGWCRMSVLNDMMVVKSLLAGYSAQPLYTSSLIATFNVVWTSWPTIGFAVLEQVGSTPNSSTVKHTCKTRCCCKNCYSIDAKQKGCHTATGMTQHGFYWHNAAWVLQAATSCYCLHQAIGCAREFKRSVQASTAGEWFDRGVALTVALMQVEVQSVLSAIMWHAKHTT